MAGRVGGPAMIDEGGTQQKPKDRPWRGEMFPGQALQAPHDLLPALAMLRSVYSDGKAGNGRQGKRNGDTFMFMPRMRDPKWDDCIFTYNTG